MEEETLRILPKGKRRPRDTYLIPKACSLFQCTWIQTSILISRMSVCTSLPTLSGAQHLSDGN